MSNQPTGRMPVFRRVLTAIGIAVIGLASVLILDKLFRGGLNAPLDFAEYWTAGKLNATRENPYSGSNVRDLQRSLGLNDTAIMMWNPPWALTLVMPVGALPFRVAYGVWVLVHLALVLLSAEMLWRAYGGAARLRWAAHLLALTFGPTIFLIGAGQITTVVLLGLAGFLYFARMDRPYLAGAFAALTAVKPHLLALFALWLLLEATRSAFGRKVLLGGLLVGLVACIPPTIANPDVWSQYWEATRGPSSADHHHVSDWTPPLVGWWARQFVVGKPFAVQWVPLAIATAAFFYWWLVKRGPTPEWAERLPWIVGISLLTAPYGAWPFDLVLLLAIVLFSACRIAEAPDRRALVAGVAWLAIVNAVFLAMMLNKTSSEWYVWFTPSLVLGSAVALTLTEPRRAVRPSAIGV